MRVLQIAKLTGGIGRHVTEVMQHSRHDSYVLDYDHAINIPLLRAFTFLFAGLPIGFFRIFKNKIDVIHSHYILPAGLLGVILGKITGTPAILTVHGSDVMRLKSLDALKKWVCRNSTVVTTTKYLQDRLLSMGIRSTIIPNGLDHEKISRAKPKSLRKPAVLFVGSLIPSKVGILPEILDEQYNYYLIGDGPMKEKLAGIKVGQIPSDEVYSYMKGADLLISTSRWEGFGLAILEAMACGLPVVARPNSAQESLVEGRGLLADSSLEFRAAIAKYFGDRKLRQGSISRGLKFSKQFSWEATSNALDRIYEGRVHKLSKGR